MEIQKVKLEGIIYKGIFYIGKNEDLVSGPGGVVLDMVASLFDDDVEVTITIERKEDGSTEDCV